MVGLFMMVFLHQNILGEPCPSCRSQCPCSCSKSSSGLDVSLHATCRHIVVLLLAGISWCFCMSYLLRRGNELLRAQISRNSELQRRKVRLLLFALPAGVACALTARHPLKLWRMFILLPPNATDLVRP